MLPPEIIGIPPVTATGNGNQVGPSTPATAWVWPIKKAVQSTAFLDQQYHDNGYGNKALIGYWHPGIDLNVGGTSGNGDVGFPVFACANGRVEYVAYRTAGGTWGPMVVISHTLPNGVVKYTRYAHLQNVTVKLGQFVGKGQKIAEIGNPANWITDPASRFPGHLHFDVMHTRPPVMTWWPPRDTKTNPVPKTAISRYFEDGGVFLRSVKAGEPS